MLYSGRPPGGKHDENIVGILLIKHIKTSLLQWSSINERIIMARFNTRFREITIVQFYTLTEVSTEYFWYEERHFLRRPPDNLARKALE